MSPPASHDHGAFESGIIARLWQHCEDHALGVVTSGDTGFLLTQNPDTVLCPDVAFVSAERHRQRDSSEAFFPGAPDLAVEIVSASNSMREVEQKAQQYLAAGATLVWVINPQRRAATEYAPTKPPVTLGISDALDGGAVVPGFRLPLRRIFR